MALILSNYIEVARTRIYYINEHNLQGPVFYYITQRDPVNKPTS